MECPESLEELDELEKLIPLCKTTLYNQAKARIESGAANSYRDAERQIAEETGKPVETIHKSVQRGKNLGTLSPSKPPWTGQFESYTPVKYIESSRLVMGNIDLDPASCEMANKTIQADKYFNLDSDGLKQKWFGKVFLNPPYKQPTIEDFITKLVVEKAKNFVSAWFEHAEKNYFKGLINVRQSQQRK